MSAPDRSPPAPRLRMQQIIINCRPGALTAESDWVAHRYIWQLAGVVEDMSIFEGVIAYVESDPSSPSLPPGVATQLVVYCDPNTPAGRVLMHFAKDVALEVEREAAYRERDDPDEADFQSMGFDCMWPLRKAIQHGAKLKENTAPFHRQSKSKRKS